MVILVLVSFTAWGWFTWDRPRPKLMEIGSLPFVRSQEEMRDQTEALVRQRVGPGLTVYTPWHAEIKGDNAVLKCKATGGHTTSNLTFFSTFSRMGSAWRLVSLDQERGQN